MLIIYDYQFRFKTKYSIYLYIYPQQGRKSMFKHGGDNIGEKYTSRLRNVLRKAPRLFRGVRGHAPREFFFKWCNLVRFGVYLDQILSLKSIYFRYTLASYGVILLKKCLEAFHD